MTSIYRVCKYFVFFIMIYSIAFGADTAPKLFKDASGLISDGKYLEAASIYNKLSNNGETDDIRAMALLYSGSVYDLYLGQPEISLKVFKKIYTDYPKSSVAPDAFFMSGRILFQMGEYRNAYDLFKTYSGLYPKSTLRRSTHVWMDRSKARFIEEPDKVKQLTEPIDKVIRVLLKKNARSLVFNSPVDIRILNLETGKTVFSGVGPVVITKKDGRIVVNSEKTSATRCRVVTENEFLSLEGIRYRGKFRVYCRPSGLMAINHIYIEQYLYGVVPKEMSWLWSEEALMAQAIASRTYALYIKSKQPKNKRYDLSATTASQVYGGYSSEKEQASRAVDKTTGKVMLYRNQLIISYFHANSGGQTESALNVWGTEMPYLKSVSDPFSSIPCIRKWVFSLSYTELENRLTKFKVKTGKIKKIKLEGRSKSGRIKAFTIISDKRQVKLSGNNFRLKIGPVELKSTWFRVKNKKGKLFFQGRGYGHGVGMSQWGAHQMGLADYSYEKILKHYYSGIEIAEAVYR